MLVTYHATRSLCGKVSRAYLRLVLTLLVAHRRRAEVCAELERRPHDEWVRRLGDADVPVSPVQDYADVADSEQLAVNGYVKEQEVIDKGSGKSFGMRKIIGTPTWFSETPVADLPGQAPALAEHTAEVLQSVGFSADEVAELAREKVVDLAAPSKL